MENSKGDAGRAALLSAFVVPGAGQIYNGQWLKGLVLAVVFLVSSLGVLIPLTLAVVNYYATINSALGQSDLSNLEHIHTNALKPILDIAVYLVILFVASIILYFYSIIDAYRFYRKYSNTHPSMDS